MTILPRGDTPFAAGAPAWRDAGWRGTLWLPPAAKNPPPAGCTGYRGRDPSGEDLARWTAAAGGRGNLALRLPRDVVGVDVDAYGGRPGAGELARLVATLGPPPATWSSTARGPGQPSRIRLYRVPPDRDWASRAAPGVDLVSWKHRFAVVWPSWHPGVGARYELYPPGREDGPPAAGRVPSPGDLATLPHEWVDELSWPYDERRVRLRAGASAEDVTRWLDALPAAGAGGACDVVRQTAAYWCGRLAGEAASRHDTARDGAWALLRDGAAGHPGARDAVLSLRGCFRGAVTGDGSRTDAGADREWERILEGGADKLLAELGTREVGAADACGCARYAGWAARLRAGRDVDAHGNTRAGRVTLAGDR